MTEGGKCTKKYINASDFASKQYIWWEKWSFSARLHSHIPPIRNRIQIERRKKSNWKTCMKQTQLCHVSNDTLAYPHSHSAQTARAHTTATHIVLRVSVSFCVWVEKGLLYIRYYYREVYRIEYIDRLYIFFWWIVIGYRQHNRIKRCTVQHREQANTQCRIESMYWNE